MNTKFDNDDIMEIGLEHFYRDVVPQSHIINNKLNMNKLVQVFKSRTFWTLVVLFVVNGVSAVHNFIPSSLLPTIDALLGIATVYFHVNPSQNYE